MANPKQNSYQSLGDGGVVGGHEGMKELVKPKVLLVRQVLGLSYAVLAATFNMRGKCQLDGFRAAMVEDIAEWPGPMSSWRESAARIQGASMHDTL